MPDYKGPIADIRPGDIITEDRFDEYRTFMVTKNVPLVKIWGFGEKYTDNGARPFRLSSKPEEPNPFES